MDGMGARVKIAESFGRANLLLSRVWDSMVIGETRLLAVLDGFGEPSYRTVRSADLVLGSRLGGSPALPEDSAVWIFTSH